jgi:protease I
MKEACAAGKTIAAICHGPIPLSAADLVKGKKLTGWLASKDSVEITGGEFKPEEWAGGEFKPEEWAPAIDGRIVSRRTPAEIPEFIEAITVALVDN